MIYKDSECQKDTDPMPAERDGEGCENCGTSYWEHDGWRCPNSSHRSNHFSNLPSDHRYLTASMQASIVHPTHKAWSDALRDAFNEAKQELESKPEEPKPVDLTDWRTWAHNKPGDCPCGIAKANCEFHR